MQMYKFRSWGKQDLEAALTSFCTATEPSEPAQSVPSDNNIQSFSELVTFLVSPSYRCQASGIDRPDKQIAL